MPDPRILIATSAVDTTADLVIQELNARGVPLARIDTGAFPDTTRLTATLGPGGWTGEVAGEHRSIRLEDIRAVYWRRPSTYTARSVVAGPPRDFAAREARIGMRVLFALPDVHWVNHPLAIEACTKPVQLAAFVRAGLRVAETWIGNVPAGHRAFCEVGPAIAKTLGPITYRADDERRVLYAARVPIEHHGHPRVAATANLIQREVVGKDFEVRVAVVGRRLFATEIRSAEPYVDIRRVDDQRLSYRPGELPSDVVRKVLAVTRSFGLTFAAWDFIAAAGELWALKLNPAGQWAFTPDHPAITCAIADELEEAANRDRHPY